MDFSSREFYEGQLKAHESVKSRLLTDIPGVKESEETQSALMFIDTTGNDFRESVDSSSNHLDDSKYNQGEADQVIRYIRFLRNSGMSDENMAIISPYNAQVNLLKLSLKEEFPGIEIGTGTYD
jgi:DNA polymerase alpha-associated DNA helicase A